jgi:hypothetical protein
LQEARETEEGKVDVISGRVFGPVEEGARETALPHLNKRSKRMEYFIGNNKKDIFHPIRIGIL